MKKLLIVLFGFIPVLSFSQRAGQIFYDDFEDEPVQSFNTPGTTWTGRQGTESNMQMILSTEYARKGQRSYKHVVNNSTNTGWQWCKAELAWNFLPAGSPLGTVGNNTAFYETPLGIKWVAASILIPNYNNDFNTVTGIGFNTKAIPDDYNTPTGLTMEQGRYRFFVTRVINNSTTQTTYYDVGPVVKDLWEDWLMERNFTDQDSGYVRLYKNGQQVLQVLGGNWKVSTPQKVYAKEPYMQMGLYKWSFDWASPIPNVNQVQMFMDEYRVGNHSATLQDMLVDYSGGGSTNTPPIVNAGSNQLLNNSTVSTTLSGSATDNGTISAYQWSKVSGPSATITTPNSATTTVTGLSAGTYVFRLTATDNLLLSSFADIQVKVNRLPILNISYTSTVYGVDSVLLSSAPTDLDGSISSTSWTQVSGSSATIVSPSSNNTVVKDLIPGDYIFRLTATDNSGESVFEDLFIMVRPAYKVTIRKIGTAKN